MNMEVGDRVKTRHPFLSSGVITQVVDNFGYVVELDEVIPSGYGWDTDDKSVVLSTQNVELEK